jgi:environmental stress-induced protein Ves
LALPANASTISRATLEAPLAMHRMLKPVDYVRMPWKNGGGQTTEIVVHPSGSTIAEFDWRVSIADVAADGPFSRFPGVDRVLVLIGGAGMRLGTDTQAAELRAAYEPYAFSGDDEVACSLLAGPVRDFNLMVRRGRAHGRVVVVRDAAARIEPARWRVCHVAAGAVECLVPGHPPVSVALDDTVVFEDEGAAPGGALAINPLSAGAVALVAVIEPVP